ncbi:MAG: hypothetical protein KKA67_04255 [Spirochaetes bacterium]|nr:hypothetical protein [Spirochaetota bacterium]MBU1080497.1 hypothetical protein [Spirochaetota bacterium]
MGRSELESVVEYILNRASPGEFEVIAKACERRRRDMGKYAGLGGVNPGALAEKMAASVRQGVDSSLEGLRDTVRDYVARIVRRQEPNASDEEIEAILDQCLPDRSGPSSGAPSGAPGRGDPEGGEGGRGAEALPPEAVVMMIRDFCDFSLGMMPPSKQQELWEGIPQWQDAYWSAFSPELRAFVKARLEGRLREDEFWSAVFSVLGL